MGEKTDVAYKNAKELLPPDLYRRVSTLAGPGLLYFPNEEARKPWGTKTGARQDIALRNAEISAAHRRGESMRSLAARYHLAPSTLRAILRKNRLTNL